MIYYSGLPLNILGQVLSLPYPVDPGGFEPPTFSMPLRRAPSCAMGPNKSIDTCGPEGIRTPDLLSAIEARSQLRYRPDWAEGIVPDSLERVKQSRRVTTRSKAAH